MAPCRSGDMRSLLVLRLAEGQRLRNGTWMAIEGDLDDIGDVICYEIALLSAVGLHEERRGLRDTNCIGELHQCTPAHTALHHLAEPQRWPWRLQRRPRCWAD